MLQENLLDAEGYQKSKSSLHKTIPTSRRDPSQKGRMRTVMKQLRSSSNVAVWAT